MTAGRWNFSILLNPVAAFINQLDIFKINLKERILRRNLQICNLKIILRTSRGINVMLSTHIALYRYWSFIFVSMWVISWLKLYILVFNINIILITKYLIQSFIDASVFGAIWIPIMLLSSCFRLGVATK